MNDGFISTLLVVGGLLVFGTAIGLIERRAFRPAWLATAAALVMLNDAALTRAYGHLPDVFGGDWNWTGKVLALLITLAVASLPWFGWRSCGLTLHQKREGLRSALIVTAAVAAIFLYFALTSSDEPANLETIAFQLTMPGAEEEPFYRGILLFALNEAFRGRVRLLGIAWGWGAILSSALFGLAHAFGYANGAVSFDLLTFLLTAVPALVAVWLRERTGSLLLPVLLHNFGNSIGLFV
jgi:membrane protease YdiL (CAAX protease family)